MIFSAAVVLGLTGCGSEEKKPPCIKSHEETIMVPMIGAKGLVYGFIPVTNKVCDKRAPKLVPMETS